MTKRLQQLVSWCLALCVAWAGTVGVSPALHRLIEHGGHGPAHTHTGVTTLAEAATRSHDHGDGQVHTHPHRPPPSQHPSRNRWLVHDHEFELPKIPLRQIWRSLSQLFPSDASTDSDSAPANDNHPGHEHHSLPQLMASGGVDQALEAPLIAPAPVTVISCVSIYEARISLPDWDAQTAIRGPPGPRS